MAYYIRLLVRGECSDSATQVNDTQSAHSGRQCRPLLDISHLKRQRRQGGLGHVALSCHAA